MQGQYNPEMAPQPQMPVYQPPPQAAYQRPPRMKWENYGMILIIVGSILIGIGVMVAGFSPGDIVIRQGTSTAAEYHPDIRMSTLQVATILAGIGTILEGLGAGFNVKAHFAYEEYKLGR